MTYVNDPSTGRSVARYVGMNLIEVGDWQRGEVVLEATVSPRTHLAGSHGGLVTGALLTMCDNVAGFCAGLAALPHGWVVSTSLMIRRARWQSVGDVRFRSGVLRAGRSSVVTDAVARDEKGLLAIATLTSAVLVPKGGVPVWERPARLVHDAQPPDGGQRDHDRDNKRSDAGADHFYRWLGIRPAPTGVGVELDVFDGLRNPWGIVHGGVTASLIDSAARAAVPGASGVVDATVHFLAPSRAGPVRAVGVPLGERRSEVVVKVVVSDLGADRVVAIAIVGVQREVPAVSASDRFP